MPMIPDPRFAQSAIVGPVRNDLFDSGKTEEPTPGLLDTLAAVSRQSHLAGAAYEFLSTARDPMAAPAPADFDPLENTAGFENEAGELADADSPSELTSIKQRISDRRADQDVLRRAGLGGSAATLVTTLLDPSFLAAVAVPEIALGRFARAGKVLTGAAQGAAGAGTYETAMQSLQGDRSMAESALNVGAGAVMGGVLGQLLGRVPRETSDELRRAISDELAGRSEAGAAAAGRASTLADVSLGAGGKTLSKAMAKTPLIGTDLDVIMSSGSIPAKRTLLDLADVPQATGENERGIATAPSVEALATKYDARVADLIDLEREQWAAYRKRVPSDERLSRDDFARSVAAAARNDDAVGIPEVDEVARMLRAKIFNPLYEEAKATGLMKAGDVPDTVIGAKSYFRRMYDRDAIRANLNEWHNTLASHFMQGDKANALEVTAAVEDVTKKILHSDVGQSNWSTAVTVPEAGPLKGRTLNVPDNLIAKFLVNDPVRVARSYVRDLAPQVELAKRFGDVDMKSRLSSISDDYNIKREKVRASDATEPKKAKELERLTTEETKTLEAIVRVRDRILGNSGRLSPDASSGARRAVQAARGWRNIVASARLGGTAITGGVMDTAKVAAQYGFMPTISKLVKLATSPEFRALSKAQARRAGSAVEVAMAKRVNIAYGGAITEGWSQKLANGVYSFTGLNHATDFNRTLSAVLLEDSVLKAAEKTAAGKPLNAYTRTRLASLGLGDDELQAVAKEIAKHGGEVDGVRVSGSADWDNKELSDIYDAAILKESKITVQQPGAADRVWWMDSELGKLIGQLKSFSLSAPTRLMSGGAQMAGQREYAKAARFFGYMMMGGYLTHALRQAISGKQPTTDASTASFEALTESGLAGVIPDVLSPLGRRLGMFGESVRYSDRNALSAYGGPALGAANDAYDFAFNRTAGGISASDLHMLRRMLPWNNVWWLRREINALEGELAEGLELKGAEAKTFGQRMIETTPSLPSKQRGGTGTGAVTY